MRELAAARALRPALPRGCARPPPEREGERERGREGERMRELAAARALRPALPRGCARPPRRDALGANRTRKGDLVAGRQRRALERRTPRKLLRRTCSHRRGPLSRQREGAGRRETASRIKHITVRLLLSFERALKKK
jgi:hypothetical protein